jgi:hypothetical protein
MRYKLGRIGGDHFIAVTPSRLPSGVDLAVSSAATTPSAPSMRSAATIPRSAAKLRIEERELEAVKSVFYSPSGQPDGSR